MREQFNKQLTELRQELVSIYTDIDLELHKAVDALVAGDKKEAKRIKKATKELDNRCQELEDATYNLIVLQQPVASDLRLLQFIIYVDFNLMRMSNHVRNIAKTAKRRSEFDVPTSLLDLLESEAHLVYRVLGTTIKAIVDDNLSLASSLPELDEPVDDVYKQFYRTLRNFSSQEEFNAATRIIMAARMLERISDNSVEAAGRLVFLLTGHRRSLSDLVDVDDDDLDDMIKAQSSALTDDKAIDEELVQKIPVEEIHGE